MNYQSWEQNVPVEFKNDPLWSVKAYRLGLLVTDIAWADVTRLMQDKRTLSLSDQLYRALGSISANVAEGYSHGTGKNRARYYEYALGSARESRDRYFKARHILGEEITLHRFSLLTQISRLLLTMIPQQRGQTFRESSITYNTNPEVNKETLESLLDNIPLP